MEYKTAICFNVRDLSDKLKNLAEYETGECLFLVIRDDLCTIESDNEVLERIVAGAIYDWEDKYVRSYW